MKNSRLFGIIYILLSKSRVSAKELAKYFEVSVRTIYRDVETLSMLNIPIYMSKGKNGGISLLESYKLDKSLLTEKEQKDILFSLESMEKLNISDNSLFNKVKAIFDRCDSSWFEVDFNVWGDSNIYKNNFEIIKNAIINKKVIKFMYFNTKGENSSRKVLPIKLCFRYNSWYLYGYDSFKDDFRLFKIMRIKDINVLDETLDKVIVTDKIIFEDNTKRINLKLEINKNLSYRVYDEFDDNCIKTLDNGNFLVEVNIPENEWLYGYILSFGEYAKVISPNYIKEIIFNKLNKSLKNYI